MCGIVASADPRDLSAAVAALAHRGPDDADILSAAGITLGHTRLAIQDPAPRSRQPFTAGPVTVAYNGELFNAPALKVMVEAAAPGYPWRTTGDTEVLAALLATLPAEQALAAIDGMFAVAWADQRTPGVLHLARDRFGEIPLHLHRAGVAVSELKALAPLELRPGHAGANVMDVAPGQHWQIAGEVAGGLFRAVSFASVDCVPDGGQSLPGAAAVLASAIGTAVDRRLISDVPVCTLLSGGIDSAVITAELASRVPGLTAYTAVLDERSADLRAAREVAAFLDIDLAEVKIPVPDADALAATIAQVELPFKAQVEIAWPCLHLAKAIASDGFKVTYSGEGSDELWASYGFGYHAITAKGWHTARRDLILAQARRNFPRVNKAFMSAGVEARLPFLDPDVVALALSLPQHAVQDGKAHPKAVLSRAYWGRLPGRIITRPKVAFQDGLGLKKAIADVLPDPGRFYRAEYARAYG